jgi:L-2-hydroxyglutarate oxidase
MQTTDVLIVGGGIVGLATAYCLTREIPTRKVTILEKEAALALHQTGRNSGVLHSGIYYRPGSLRALNCRVGKLAMEQFCAAEGIAYEICGKVIVATTEAELPAMQRIFERGQANGVKCEMIDRSRLLELEPHTAGIKAIHVPEAGIVDYPAVCRRLAQRIEEAGGQIVCRAGVRAIQSKPEGVIVESAAGEFVAQFVVTCAGLHSDRVARMSGQKIESKIIPFRGEFSAETGSRTCVEFNLSVPDPIFRSWGAFHAAIHPGVSAVPTPCWHCVKVTDAIFRCAIIGDSGVSWLQMAADTGHWLGKCGTLQQAGLCAVAAIGAGNSRSV